MSFFDYFQLASLVFFIVLIAARIIYLRSRRGTNPVAIGRGKKGFHFIFEIYAFAALAGWMIEVISYALHIQLRVLPSILHLQVIDSPVAKIIGVLLITTGFVTLILAFVSFGDSWRIGFDVRTLGQLVTTGIFGFSRNPIYVCLNLWFIGTFLINGTLIPYFRLAGNYSPPLPNSAGREILIGIVWPTVQRLFGENWKVLVGAFLRGRPRLPPLSNRGAPTEGRPYKLFYLGDISRRR